MSGGKALTPQIIYECTGELMRPLAYHYDLFTRTFESGKRYQLIEFRERSRETHDHFFATVAGYWHNWPENYERELPSADHLRKHALIRTGHYIQCMIVHSSLEAASAYVRNFIRYVDYAEGSIASTVNGTATVMRMAKSQRKNVMDDKEFARSKNDVLDFCQAVTGIPPEQMKREVKKGGAA